MRIVRPGLLKDLPSDPARAPGANRIGGTLRRNIIEATVSIGPGARVFEHKRGLIESFTKIPK
jgi:hypothetical protein